MTRKCLIWSTMGVLIALGIQGLALNATGAPTDPNPCAMLKHKEIADLMLEDVVQMERWPRAKTCVYYLTHRRAVYVRVSVGNAAGQLEAATRGVRTSGETLLPVPGVGDRAFLRTGTVETGIYVIKGDTYLSIFSGDPTTREAYVKLARIAVTRLP